MKQDNNIIINNITIDCTCNDIAIVDIVDLADITNHYFAVFNFLSKNYKSKFECNEGIIFYSAYRPPYDLLYHLQKALIEIDISNDFIHIATPFNILDDLINVRDRCAPESNIINQKICNINFSKILECNFKLSSTFCPMPWASIEVAANGNFRPCCVFSRKSEFNIKHNTIDEFRYSSDMVALRKSLLNGESPEECNYCWNSENTGNSSNRTYALTLLKKEFYNKRLSSDPIELRLLDIKQGNYCNLKCRICSPYLSSQIALEQNIKIDGNWSKQNLCWDKLKKIADTIKYIDIYGGEPLLHTALHVDFLTFLHVSNMSKNIRLHYNTNGTIWPTEFFKVWTGFKQVNISFSIDDIGKRFEYQRKNASWNIVQDNLQNFKKISDSTFSFSFFVTISIFNVLYVDQIISYLEQFNWPIHLNLLTSPSQLSIFNIPDPIANAILNKKEQYINTLLTPILQIMQTQQHNLESKSIVDYISAIDNIRSESLTDSHPELAALLQIN